MDVPSAIPGSINTGAISSAAIQALLPRQDAAAPEMAILMALAGQDVEILLQALEPQGVRLQLSSGQSFVAQGELPYPPGTQLTVRVVPPSDTSGLRLQTLEAKPPASSALLIPLRQSEAAALQSRLQQTEPESELLPLIQLMKQLMDAPVSTSTPGRTATQAPLTPALELPSVEQLTTGIQALPQALQQSLAKALDLPFQTPAKELAQALESWLRKASTADVDTAAPEESLPTRFQAQMARRPDIPEQHAEKLANWLQEQTTPKPGTKPAETSASRLETTRQLANDGASTSQASKPESWESWIRGTTQALSDPAVSPREAPFHQIQAKEGTAFFELPLPWKGSGPLQMWVESDAGDRKNPNSEPTQRILLGVQFSNLGETRIGLMRRGSGLQVRIWTEHPEAMESTRPQLANELRGLAGTVDLQIQTLPSGTPSIRALVADSSIQALG